MPRSYPAGHPTVPSRYRLAHGQPGRPSDRRPASRLDAEGRRQVAPTWESLVERQLREAMEEGAFDELPYQGERLPMEDDTAGGRVGAGLPDAPQRRRRAAVDRGRQGGPRGCSIVGTRSWRGAAPLASRQRLRDRAALEAVVIEINAAIARLNAEAPTDRQHRRPLDLRELARLDAMAPRRVDPPEPELEVRERSGSNARLPSRIRRVVERQADALNDV